MTTPRRTREQLLPHDVFIDDNIASVLSKEVPARVREVIGVLLNFEKSIPIEWQNGAHFRKNLAVLSKEYRKEGGHCTTPPKDAFFGDRLPIAPKSDGDIQKNTANYEVGECVEIATGFKKHERQLEDDLTDRYRFAVFRAPEQLHRSYDKTSKITWTLHRNVPWTEEFPCFRSTSTRIADSKPDLFYGLRVARSDHDDFLHGKDPTFTRNLRIDVLSKLRWKGVSSTITKALWTFYNEDSSKMVEKICSLDDHNLTCFPFAVVELKKEITGVTDVEVCECQAAAASVRALSLYKHMFQEAYWWALSQSPQHSARQPPPIVAFTCIGAKVRVWLTYLARDKIVMRCIYSTNLVLTWGVLSLRRIVRNMLTWQENVVAGYLLPALDALQERYEIKRKDTIYESDGTTQHGNSDILPSDRVLSSSPEPVEADTDDLEDTMHDRDQGSIEPEESSTSQRAQSTPASALPTPPQASQSQQTDAKSTETQPTPNPGEPSSSFALEELYPSLESLLPRQTSPTIAKAELFPTQPGISPRAQDKSKQQSTMPNYIFGSNTLETDAQSNQFWTRPSDIVMPPLGQNIFSFSSDFSTPVASSHSHSTVIPPKRSAFLFGAPKVGPKSATLLSGSGSAHEQTRSARLPESLVTAEDKASRVKLPSPSRSDDTLKVTGVDGS